jgi:hypothetical protein
MPGPDLLEGAMSSGGDRKRSLSETVKGGNHRCFTPVSHTEAGAMSEQTRERTLDEPARALASGSLSRRNVLYATGGSGEVYEWLQQNAGLNGAE